MSDIHEHSNGQHIGRDHQLPAPLPWYRNWVLWAGALLILGVAIAIYVLNHGSDTKATTSKSGQGAAKATVTATVATASKGNIGIYLSAIGTVTPVYTASITAQASLSLIHIWPCQSCLPSSSAMT